MNAAQPAWTPGAWRRHLAEVIQRLRRLRLATQTAASDSPEGTPPTLSVVDRERGDDAFAGALRAFATCERDVHAIALALAAEVDGEASRLISFFDGDTDGRPSLRLAEVLWAEADERGSIGGDWMTAFAFGPVVAEGLIELEGNGTLPTRTLRVDPELVPRLIAANWSPPTGDSVVWHPREPALSEVELSPAARASLRRWCQGDSRPPLVLAAPPRSGRTTMARCAAAELGLDVLELRISTLADVPTAVRIARRESRLRPCAVVVALRLDEEPAWSPLHDELSAVRAPVIVEVPIEWGDRASESDHATALLVQPLPGWHERSLQWASLAGDSLTRAQTERLAARYPFPVGRLVTIVQRAQNASPGPVGYAELERCCREVSAELMTTLTERLPQPHRRDDLVVSAEILAELDLAITWVEQQGRVMEGWGYDQRISLGRGLTALFSGPPGTGKTMAAQVLARELGMEIFRVDLSRVVDKYIGETEKNLGRLFDHARRAGAILFFDEADALFGKRTAVKDAHDRHANVEIGYLLQRMESHEGPTILATNRSADMDDAFARRFHIRVSFARPSAGERARIWRGMFPPEAELKATVTLEPFAEAFDFTGGEIRNAVLCAAYLAAADDSPIANRHLVAASVRELRKQGKSPSQRSQRLMQGLPD